MGPATKLPASLSLASKSECSLAVHLGCSAQAGTQACGNHEVPLPAGGSPGLLQQHSLDRDPQGLGTGLGLFSVLYSRVLMGCCSLWVNEQANTLLACAISCPQNQPYTVLCSICAGRRETVSSSCPCPQGAVVWGTHTEHWAKEQVVGGSCLAHCWAPPIPLPVHHVPSTHVLPPCVLPSCVPPTLCLLADVPPNLVHPYPSLFPHPHLSLLPGHLRAGMGYSTAARPPRWYCGSTEGLVPGTSTSVPVSASFRFLSLYPYLANPTHCALWAFT